MGRGNFRVSGKYEGLVYIDKDCFAAMSKKSSLDDGDSNEIIAKVHIPFQELDDYEEDDLITEENYQLIINSFKDSFCRKFKSFLDTGEMFGEVLENELYTINIEDNEWSYAVLLLQKDIGNEGLQKRHFERYLDAIKEILFTFDDIPKLGLYGGAWTHGTLTREEYLNKKNIA